MGSHRSSVSSSRPRIILQTRQSIDGSNRLEFSWSLGHNPVDSDLE